MKSAGAEILIGKRLSHYRIVRELGAGGMGIVYLARDERLDREVALKLLPRGIVIDPKARERLRREARTLAQLNHPHIAAIYDFDSHEELDFLVMELIPGESLAQALRNGPLPEQEAIAVCIQIAEALEEAHAAEIIHRDLKPGNVMLTPRRSVKVLDFGLSKSLQPELMTSLTESGQIAGTLPYMAPEQFRSTSVDARTDIYALGAVLYETATGVRAFPHETPAMLIEAVLGQPPKPPREIRPELSPSLEAIILRALEKNPDRRFSSAGEMGAALQEFGGTQAGISKIRARRPRKFLPVAWAVLAAVVIAAILLLRGGPLIPGARAIQSLAVLPLEDLSSDSRQSYFADGMTDALITKLAQVRNLRVISRTSSMRTRATQDPLPEIAKKLHVDALVMGAVLRVGDRVRISAQLLDGASDRHLWANTYERDLGDVLALQSDLAAEIADQVRVRLTPVERDRLAHSEPVKPEAYDEYLKGRFEWNKRTGRELEAARDHFLSASRIDPRFALAYAGLADVYVLLDQYAGYSVRETLPRAEEAARKAIDLDAQLAEAYPALGLVKLYSHWDWKGAEADLQRAIELRPSYSTAHHWYSIVLRGQGRFEEALSNARRAVDLDPLSLIVAANLGDVYFFARRYDDAIRQHRIGRELDPAFAPTHLYLAMAFERRGLLDSALVECRTAQGLQGGRYALGGLGYVLGRLGRRPQAEQVLHELEQLAALGQPVSFDIGLVHVGLGQGDQAIAWLERAGREQPSGIKDLGVDPRLDSIRAHPKFGQLLQRIGLGQNRT